MRKLVTMDVFSAARIITRSGIKEKLAPVLKAAAEKGVNVQDIGISGILTVLETVADEKCEQAIYKWLAGPFEMTDEEVKMLDLADLAEKLEELKEENDLANFFAVLSRLISKK